MADLKLNISDLPLTTDLYAEDVFMLDQLGGDSYTKQVTYETLKNKINDAAGVAKAWIKFGGTGTTGSATVSASFNVASVTNLGVGDFQIDWESNTFSDNNYCVIATAQLSAAKNDSNSAVIAYPYEINTNNVKIEVDATNTAGSNVIVTSVSVVAYSN